MASISNEDLFKEYSRLLKLLGHYPLGVSGYKEINDNSIYRAGVYKKRFKGGLKGFAIEYIKWTKNSTSKSVDIKDTIRIKEKVDVVIKAPLLEIQSSPQGKSLYLIQVKHSEYDKASESKQIQITASSLERNRGLNVFYILVLSRKEPSLRDFLILPYSKVDELIKIGVLQQLDDAKHISFKVLHKTPQDAYIGEYKDSSKRIKISKRLGCAFVSFLVLLRTELQA